MAFFLALRAWIVHFRCLLRSLWLKPEPLQNRMQSGRELAFEVVAAWGGHYKVLALV